MVSFTFLSGPITNTERTVSVSLALGLLPALAGAQTFESIGVRAQGLGGAFVAVADDATASWWNPAGQATGAYLSAVLEKGRTTEPSAPTSTGPAVRTTSTDFAIAFPALGLSHYRLRISEIAPISTTATGSAGRQDPGGTGSPVRSVGINQYSATLGQSIGDAVVVGATVKVLQAGAVVGTSVAASPLDDADGLDIVRQSKLDADLGVMMKAGHLRLGATLKNVTQPSFGAGTTTLELFANASNDLVRVFGTLTYGGTLTVTNATGFSLAPGNTFNLFDFKTLFVNAPDKKEALDFFWKNYDPTGYSLWYIKYIKYEGEGVKLFLTSNLMQGTLQRLDEFR